MKQENIDKYPAEMQPHLQHMVRSYKQALRDVLTEIGHFPERDIVYIESVMVELENADGDMLLSGKFVKDHIEVFNGWC